MFASGARRALRAHHVAGRIRFGGVLESHECDALGTPAAVHLCCLTFEYYGVEVDAYTFIPIT